MAAPSAGSDRIRWSRSWNEALRRAKYNAPAKAASVSTSAVEYDAVSRARMVCTSGLDHVAHATQGVDQLRPAPVIDLLAQPRDHDVHDVRPRIEVIIPGVLGDQRARHHPALMAHQVLEHGVLLRGELDRLAAALHLAAPGIEGEVGDLQHRRGGRPWAAAPRPPPGPQPPRRARP